MFNNEEVLQKSGEAVAIVAVTYVVWNTMKILGRAKDSLITSIGEMFKKENDSTE